MTRQDTIPGWAALEKRHQVARIIEREQAYIEDLQRELDEAPSWRQGTQWYVDRTNAIRLSRVAIERLEASLTRGEGR